MHPDIGCTEAASPPKPLGLVLYIRSDSLFGETRARSALAPDLARRPELQECFECLDFGTQQSESLLGMRPLSVPAVLTDVVVCTYHARDDAAH